MIQAISDVGASQRQAPIARPEPATDGLDRYRADWQPIAPPAPPAISRPAAAPNPSANDAVRTNRNAVQAFDERFG